MSVGITTFDCDMCKKVYDAQHYEHHKQYFLDKKQFSQMYGLIFINYVLPVGYESFGDNYIYMIGDALHSIGLAYPDFLKGKKIDKHFKDFSMYEKEKNIAILENLKKWGLKINWTR